MTSGYLVGVDGGGSKTLALVADLQGQTLGRGVAGPSNYHAVGVETAYAALDSAIATACAEARVEARLPRALCLGLAGVDHAEDRPVIQTWLGKRYPDIPVSLVNDGHLVLAAGLPEGWGVALICGTGSTAYGCDAQGRAAHTGGWGYLLGDEGSGYAIGLGALRAVAHAADGRGPQTQLTPAILDYWSLEKPQHLISQVYRAATKRSDIAALCVLVEAAAAAGDGIAQALLQDAGHEMALAVQAVARNLDLVGAIPCALAGSVFVKGKYVLAALRASAAELGLHLEPLTLVDEPAQGALKLAQQLLSNAA